MSVAISGPSDGDWSMEDRRNFFELHGWAPGDAIHRHKSSEWPKMGALRAQGIGICGGCGYALDDHNDRLSRCP